MRGGICALVALLALGVSLAQAPGPPLRSAEPEQAASQVEKLRFAAGQHEIIRVLLEEARFPEVLPEYEKILALGLEGKREKPLISEAWFIVEKLRKAGEFRLAHQVVDLTLEKVQNRASKFFLFILKGKVFHDQGKNREAIEAYRKAQEFKE